MNALTPTDDHQDENGDVIPAPQTASAEFDPMDNPRRHIIVGMIVLLVFFGGFGGWAAMAPLDAAVPAQGTVVVSGNRKAVQHEHGGTIESLLIEDGDFVTKGDLLLALETEELESSRSRLLARLITLRAREARLIAQRDGLDTLTPGPWLNNLTGEAAREAADALASERAQLTTRVDNLAGRIELLQQRKNSQTQRINGLGSQIEATERRLTLTREQLESTRDLYERGLSPLTQVRNLESTIAGYEGELGRLRAGIGEAREQISELDFQIATLRDDLDVDVATLLTETQREIAEVEPQYEAIALRIDQSDIRATDTGRVVNLQVFTEGGVISPGQILMEIVPSGEPLVIRARISPSEADDVIPGLEAQVRLRVGRGRENPIMNGVVRQISADRLIDEASGVPYFAATVEVPPEELERFQQFVGQDVQLSPGYPADVVIPLRSRSMLDYILEPITGALWRSFREN